MKAIYLLAGMLLLGATLQAQTLLQFAFGPAPDPTWTQVTPASFYSTNTGFGFEPGADLVVENHSRPSLASTRPFYFSVQLPEGNYLVTATFDEGSDTTIKAELRRLMIEKNRTQNGSFTTRKFVVNIRTPKISGKNHVHLKQRELSTEMWNWDDKLTLEFNGPHPAVHSLKIERVEVPTVFLIGDSTVCDQPAAPWNSWGQMLPRFFQPDVAVANNAESGETIENSLHAQRFEKIYSQMKPGDYLFVQFGHNDMKSHATNALEVYSADLKSVVEHVRKLGGTPVLVTSMERKNGIEQDTLMGYPQAVRDVAKAEDCALIDLNAMSKVFYRALGGDLDKAFQDGTHHNNYGSYELAKCVVLGIQQAHLPLAGSIVNDFGGFDPAHPDPVATFEMAVSPVASTEKPLGN